MDASISLILASLCQSIVGPNRYPNDQSHTLLIALMGCGWPDFVGSWIFTLDTKPAVCWMASPLASETIPKTPDGHTSSRPFSFWRHKNTTIPSNHIGWLIGIRIMDFEQSPANQVLVVQSPLSTKQQWCFWWFICGPFFDPAVVLQVQSWLLQASRIPTYLDWWATDLALGGAVGSTKGYTHGYPWLEPQRYQVGMQSWW